MCVKAILIIAMECVTKVMPFEIGLEGGEGLSCLGRFLGTGSSKGTNADVGKCTPSTSCSSFGIFNDPLAYLVFLLPLFVYNIICTFFIHAKISSLWISSCWCTPSFFTSSCDFFRTIKQNRNKLVNGSYVIYVCVFKYILLLLKLLYIHIFFLYFYHSSFSLILPLLFQIEPLIYLFS